MELALTDLFRAKWSPAVHEEWMNALAKDRPDISREKLENIRNLIDTSVRDCLVTDYKSIIPSISLPDVNDRHILAAAVKGRCDLIVTYNLKDFPAEELAKLSIEAQHPDEFLCHLLDLSPGKVCAAVRVARTRFKNPPIGVGEFLATLEQASLVSFVANLRSFAEVI